MKGFYVGGHKGTSEIIKVDLHLIDDCFIRNDGFCTKNDEFYTNGKMTLEVVGSTGRVIVDNAGDGDFMPEMMNFILKPMNYVTNNADVHGDFMIEMRNFRLKAMHFVPIMVFMLKVTLYQ